MLRGTPYLDSLHESDRSHDFNLKHIASIDIHVIRLCVRVLNLTRVVDGVSPPSHDMIGGINHDLTSFCFGLRGDSPQRPEITNFVTAIRGDVPSWRSFVP